MAGFALYQEAVVYDSMPAESRERLSRGGHRVGAWQALVESCIEKAGGEIRLPDLYRMVEPRRPTPNPWWQEKIRQVLQRHFRPVEKGVWAMPAREEAA